jgi:hypothetical protein
MDLYMSEDTPSIFWQDDQALAEFIKAQGIEQVEHHLLQHEQVDCPVIHTFGPGLYIREVTIPKGAFAIGHKQVKPQMNIFLKGRMIVFDAAGNPHEIAAPMMFTGPPGRKVGYALEDVTWLNVYADGETDVSILEATYLEKSETWQQHYQTKALEGGGYEAMLDEIGVTEEVVRRQTEDEEDQIPMPHGSYKFCVNSSPIQGKGLFASATIRAGEVIGPARLDGKRTPIGRYCNHSDTPNAEMQAFGQDLYLVAMKDLQGCRGGELGEEITTDYRLNIQKARETSCPQ